jgi:uncharacterized protein (TIGR02001 family)
MQKVGMFFGVFSALAIGLSSARAQVSSTITLTNDYDFRGFSQSAKDPALQASIDYALENGLAFGAWASNVDFDSDADVEVDLYANFSRELNETLSFTAGLTFYAYPSSDDVGDYLEGYIGLDTAHWSFKQWYANDYLDLGSSAWYSEGNGTYELPHGLSLLAHLGYGWGSFWDDLGGGEIFDYSLGVGYSVQQFNLTLKLTGTDASGEQKIRSDVNNNEARVVFSIATTLPWE